MVIHYQERERERAQREYRESTQRERERVQREYRESIERQRGRVQREYREREGEREVYIYIYL